ncbi:hypothetical protein A3219_23645, partial [Salmonella enterica]
RIGELDSHTRRPWIINDNFANNLSDNEVNVTDGREGKAPGLGNWIRIPDARGLLMITSQITFQTMR